MDDERMNNEQWTIPSEMYERTKIKKVKTKQNKMFKRLTNKTLMQALLRACFVVLFVVATVAGFAAQNAKAAAGIPLIVNYQARVTNATGTPITTATNMRFII